MRHNSCEIHHLASPIPHLKKKGKRNILVVHIPISDSYRDVTYDAQSVNRSVILYADWMMLGDELLPFCVSACHYVCLIEP